MQLTARDVAIVRLVSRHRFLRSNEILSLIGGSAQQVLRRLQLLFHHGYLDRPRAQLDYFHQGGSRPIVYGLGNSGAKLLAGGSPDRIPRFDWTRRNRSVKQLYLEHSLLVSEVMVGFEKSASASKAVRLIREEELSADIALRDPFRWKVNVHSHSLGLQPDKVFGLENLQTGERLFYFLEADRATMPIKRRTFHQSSFFRKLVAYEATWAQGIHRSRFGFRRFRVLTVTNSTARLGNILSACQTLKSAQGLFLFADKDSLIRSEPLAYQWRGTEAHEHARLIDF